MNSTSMPTPEEQAMLIHIGTSVLVSTISVVVESCLWIIGVILFIWAVRLQISSQKLSTTFRGQILMGVSIYLFMSSTALWAMGVYWAVIGAKAYFLNAVAGVSLETITVIRKQYQSPLGLPMELLFLLNMSTPLTLKRELLADPLLQMIVGDSVVIWRAWVICSPSRLQKLMFIPIIMLLTSLAFTAISANCLLSQGFSGSTTHAVGARTCEWGEPIAWAVSLLTNFASTSLIAAVAWHHRRFLRDANLSDHNSTAQRVLITLVESGFIYCLVWLTQLDLFIPANYAYTFKFSLQGFFGPLGDQISAIYVMGIIVLVKKKQSVSDLTQVLSVSGPSNNLVFASQGQQRNSRNEIGTISVVRSAPHAQELGSTDESDGPIRDVRELDDLEK